MEEVLTEKDKLIKYPSIENTYIKEFLDKIRMKGLSDKRWLITEKVHGSNISISYDGKEVFVCTRNHVLAEDEKCYNMQDIIKSNFLEDKVKEVYETFKKSGKIFDKVVLYGEVCGGSYPHADVPRDNHACRVQKGVFYSPHNQWLLFDICTVKDDTKNFLGGQEFLYVARALDITTVPFLSVATSLEEALNYDNAGMSRVGTEIYGLPSLEDNVMEGVVIRGYDEDYWLGQHRVILKNKNDKYSEKSHERKIPIQPKELPEEIKEVLAKVSQYITENRMNNIFSHYGELQRQNFGKILCEANKDVIEAAQKDGLFNTLQKQDIKIITKEVNREIANIIKKMFIDKMLV